MSASLWLLATICTCLYVVAAGFLAGFEVNFASVSSAKALMLIGAIGFVSIMLQRPAPRSTLALSSFLVLTVAGAAAGILSMVGQMFAFPLIDARLAAADQWLGVTSGDVVRAVISIPGAPMLLGITYVFSILLLFLTAFALACLGRSERLWELCASYCFCILVATVLSFVFPAAGAFDHLGHADLYGARLPGGSGVYHLKSFHALRGAPEVVIDPFRLQGLVTFPSFHTAMALMTAAAWRDDRAMRWPMIVWNALVIISTVPIGGHYLVDLAGGALTWALIFRHGPSIAAGLEHRPIRSANGPAIISPVTP